MIGKVSRVAMDITMITQMLVSGKERKNQFLLKQHKYDFWGPTLL